MNQPEIPLIDVRVIEGALINAAPFYYCWMMHGVGSSGATQIALVNAELDALGVTAANARTFAQGLTAAFGIFKDVAKQLEPEAIRQAALLLTEALRRSGDLTDEHIASICCAVKRDEQEWREAAAEGLRIVKEHFSRSPFMPGSARNN